ncbi:TPA: PhzF family phenazine biosynthesis protein [Candidatus Poribacteria bacterium]|nr:PhzF family phenazine biosynthesis protein [Candidatus Poribacteria bacterium]
MKYRYCTCDVFTEKRFGGNQLAVLPEALGLSDIQMQQIAREFNFSETAFVLPPEKGQTRKVRIFTPTTEVPFAGHPNIGTAFVLAEIGELGKDKLPGAICFEEKAGLVPIEIQIDINGPTVFELKAPQILTLDVFTSIALLAGALSLNENDFVSTTHPPSVASVGLPFLFAEVRDTSVLARVRINTEAFELLAKSAVPYIHVYTWKPGSSKIQARMFAPLDGVSEDPATGSANCALAALLAHHNPDSSGEFSWRVFQGKEMGRSSLLKVRARKENGCVIASWVAGSCVMVCEGHIDVDSD